MLPIAEAVAFILAGACWARLAYLTGYERGRADEDEGR